MNKPEWVMTTADFKKAEVQGILDYGNNKLSNGKKVSLYRCKYEAIETFARNKILKHLAGRCTVHADLFNKQGKSRVNCTLCLAEIVDYLKEEK